MVFLFIIVVCIESETFLCDLQREEIETLLLLALKEIAG